MDRDHKAVVQMSDREALEKILRLINTHGGENPGANYQLLVQIRKISKQALANG
jgi:hypothetical protein